MSLHYYLNLGRVATINDMQYTVNLIVTCLPVGSRLPAKEKTIEIVDISGKANIAHFNIDPKHGNIPTCINAHHKFHTEKMFCIIS